MVRKGASNNVMVFPEANYDNSAFGILDGDYTFTHRALGADMFRYSWNFGKSWTEWNSWEDVTTIDSSVFEGHEKFWEGQHITVQCAF
jgi:alpha-1,3-glucan synthase